jgi:hypothetical protein
MREEEELLNIATTLNAMNNLVIIQVIAQYGRNKGKKVQFTS